MKTNTQILDAILRRESSEYTDIAGDRGGPTKFGITLKALSEWWGLPATARDVQLLTEEEARRIYTRMYFTDPKFERINSGELRALVVDCGVNHGVSRASKWLQHAVGTVEDGVVGDQTLLALARMAPLGVFMSIMRTRLAFYARIATDDLGLDPDRVFLRGWINRASEFLHPDELPL